MTKKNHDNIPIVQAVAVGPDTSNGVYFVDLPIGPANLKFGVQGSPPQISVVHYDSPVAGQLTVGNYIHGLIMPDIEIVSLVDPVHLQTLIQANAGNPRRLMISSSPFYVDSSAGSNTTVPGALYKHTLPASSSLGVGFKGFPPVITVVAPSSLLAGRLHPGQTVAALLVPGQPIFNLAAGGFTSDRLEQRLLDTFQMQGRKLIVRDGQPAKGSKASSRAFDDCVIS